MGVERTSDWRQPMSQTDPERTLKLGAHHPMVPVELANFIGLDTSIMQVLDEGWPTRNTGRARYW